MSDRGTGGEDDRLRRCIRDLAALSALPSMCVGRSYEAALSIVMDALPTALGCDLVCLSLPGSPPKNRGAWRGRALGEEELAAVHAALDLDDGALEGRVLDLPFAGGVHCLDADVPIGAVHGRLIAGRTTPLDPETDRVLVRSAANLAGSALESASVLEAARRKDEFLAMLGHELRNPLAPILTAAELLTRIPAAARPQQVIERNTRHLTRLVDDLLDIARVGRGVVELRHELVSLSAVLDRAIEIATPLIERNRHTLRVTSVEDVVVEGDPVRLAQVFGNLLTNAAKFTPAGGTIDVAVERAGGCARVCVRDDGRGIEAHQLQRIFEPFVQADGERDALRGGLGLGLAIVKSLVERHGGRIGAESEGRGRGAAFTVELPIAFGTPAPADRAPRREAVVRAGRRVLVVDDNPDIAELLSIALENEGFETAVAHDARTALETWRSFEPDAGVLDVGLAEIDGYELARKLRAEHGARPILIAATGYGEDRDRAAASAAGFDRHFVKPVSILDLVAALDERTAPSRAGGDPARE